MANDITGRLIGDFRQLLFDMTNGRDQSLPLRDDFYEGVTITDAVFIRIPNLRERLEDLDLLAFPHQPISQAPTSL